MRCVQDFVLVAEKADGNARLRLGVLRPSYERAVENVAFLGLLKMIRRAEASSSEVATHTSATQSWAPMNPTSLRIG